MRLQIRVCVYVSSSYYIVYLTAGEYRLSTHVSLFVSRNVYVCMARISFFMYAGV